MSKTTEILEVDIIDSILTVDLATEKFTVLKANQQSIFYNKDVVDQPISQWYLNNIFLPDKDYIHPNDAEGFLSFINVYTNYVDFYEKGICKSTFYYRCLSDDNCSYRWKRIDVIPTKTFCKDKPVVYVFIGEVSEEIARSLTKKYGDEKYSVGNYSDFINRVGIIFEDSINWLGSLGIIAFSANYLEEDMNDFIKNYFAPVFGKENCYYAITNDKNQVVYVVLEGKTQEEFYNNMLIVHKRLKKENKDYNIYHIWTDDEDVEGNEFLQRLNNKTRF